MMRLLYRMLLPISNQYFMQQGGGCLKGKNFNNMTAFLLKSPLYKRNCSKLKNIIAFLRGSSETINGYIFTSHHCLGSWKNGLKSQQCGDREEKELRQMTSFLDLEKTPFLYWAICYTHSSCMSSKYFKNWPCDEKFLSISRLICFSFQEEEKI